MAGSSVGSSEDSEGGVPAAAMDVEEVAEALPTGEVIEGEVRATALDFVEVAEEKPEDEEDKRKEEELQHEGETAEELPSEEKLEEEEEDQKDKEKEEEHTEERTSVSSAHAKKDQKRRTLTPQVSNEDAPPRKSSKVNAAATVGSHADGGARTEGKNTQRSTGVHPRPVARPLAGVSGAQG